MGSGLEQNSSPENRCKRKVRKVVLVETGRNKSVCWHNKANTVNKTAKTGRQIDDREINRYRLIDDR